MKLIRSIKSSVEKDKPLWIMRQAGRYLPEYQELRKKVKNFIEFCLNEEMVLEATLQPIRRFDFDAAIIFSDILIIPHFLGQKVRFEEGVGPILDEPNWDEIINSHLSHEISVIYDSIKLVRRKLDKEKALIGFAGCPWTLASYMISFGKTSDFSELISFAKEWPRFEQLINKLVKSVSDHAVSQLKAGADVVQLFESWAGSVPTAYRKKWLFEPSTKIIQNIRIEVPEANIIYYGRGVSNDAIIALNHLGITFGISEDIDLLDLPSTSSCLQGNLDPKKLREGNFESDTLKILEFSRDCPFIVNLGHGILPDTPLSHVEKFVRLVRDEY